LLFPAILLAVLSSCATTQAVTLPDKVVEAEIMIPIGEQVLVD
jgi:hypothetical protein